MYWRRKKMTNEIDENDQLLESIEFGIYAVIAELNELQKKIGHYRRLYKRND